MTDVSQTLEPTKQRSELIHWLLMCYSLSLT